MKQVLQNWKTGEIGTEDVPSPALRPKSGVLVKTHYSLISAGTERTSVEFAQSNLVDKARSKPDEVKKILRDVRQQGFWSVYERVQRKMKVPVPRGYSCAGIVLAVSDDVDDLRPGDRVACGGQGAYHADIVSVRRNLCVKLADTVSLDDAAYTTLGSIAMQGVRQAAPTLGETVVVIGLGLVGQITIQILKANGCNVIGVDLSPYHVDAAKKSGADHAFVRTDSGLNASVLSVTDGYGADAVIITAATESNDPIELAATLCRNRGRIVLVGVSKIDIPRDVFYQKELEFKLSRSYGPGRYDLSYEEHGVDYPIEYVRWTERRNMQAFAELLAQKKIALGHITTHRFSIDDAEKAYAMLSGENKNYIGLLIEYEKETPASAAGVIAAHLDGAPAHNAVAVGFIGAGSFAQTHLLPHLKADNHVALVGVCNSQGSSAKFSQSEFGFGYSCAEPEQIFADEKINTVFVATRHNTHAPLAAEALKRGRNVFVEKPLALSEEELATVEAAWNERKPVFLVGFNRRFAPLVKQTKDFFEDVPEPLVVQYHVNAGFIPKQNWTQDEEEGGGRIIGEVCHFVDTVQYLTGSEPVKVYAQSIASSNEAATNSDNIIVTLTMKNGSIASITYVANNDNSVPKELCTVSGGKKTAVMTNFQSLDLYKNGAKRMVKAQGIDKGHKAEVAAFVHAVATGGQSPIPFKSLALTTRVTFAIRHSIACGEPVEL
jgi:polar amino acid transport system substrate-binding protein